MTAKDGKMVVCLALNGVLGETDYRPYLDDVTLAEQIYSKWIL